MTKQEILEILKNYENWKIIEDDLVFLSLFAQYFSQSAGIKNNGVCFNRKIRIDTGNIRLSSNEIFRLYAFAEDKRFCFSIYEKGESLYVYLLLQIGGHTSTYVYDVDLKRLTLMEETILDHHIVDYHETICYYDSNFQLMDKDVEEELDDSFCAKFDIPKGMARRLRTNFKENAIEIEAYIQANSTLPKRNKDNVFAGPLSLERIGGFIQEKQDYTHDFCPVMGLCNECLNNHLCIDHIANKEDFGPLFPHFNNVFDCEDRIDVIQKVLGSYFAQDEEIVISHALYHAIEDYIALRTNMISDVIGTIIIKTEKGFAIYYASFNLGYLYLIKRNGYLTSEEIKQYTQFNPTLEEFFGNDRPKGR